MGKSSQASLGNFHHLLERLAISDWRLKRQQNKNPLLSPKEKHCAKFVNETLTSFCFVKVTLTARWLILGMVRIRVLKSLYRIRQELANEGIEVSPDWLYHIARRNRLRLRVVSETYEYRREVYGADEDDAEILKRLVRQAVQHSKRRRPSAAEGT